MTEDHTKYVRDLDGVVGTVLALTLSYKLYGLTWWVLLHGLFGWYYVGYWVVMQSGVWK